MNFRKLNIYFILPLILITLLFFIPISYNTNTLSKYMLVHYIDVGQGDAVLIQVNNKNLLIDSGPSTNKQNLINYLDKLKIKYFDYVIATHPHEDHIGNMSTVIRKYKISNFYAPKISHNSLAFEKMVTSLVDKNLKIKIIDTETKNINLGNNTKVSVFSPNKNCTSDNLNEYSPIIKIDFLNTSFLFTGDAEKSNEFEVLSSSYNLKSDVIKIGHHGSDTSSSEEFLSSVMPTFAIISVGKNNKYNHPTETVLETLNKKGVDTLRTDILGTIVFISDGDNLKKINIK